MHVNLRPTLLLLALALASCSQPVADPTNPGGSQPAIPLEGDALVIGQMDGAVADGITKSMRLTTYDGSQKPGDFDVIIFDGDANSPDAVKAEPLVAQALRSGKWVLGLDVTEAHKTTGLGDLTLGVSKGPSPAYATKVQRDAMGRHAVDVFEYPNPDATTTVDDKGPAAPTIQKASKANIDTDAFVKTLVSRLTSPTVRPAQSDNNIPAGLIYATFNYSYPVPWTKTGTGRTGNSQNLQFTANYTATVFLNNKNNPQGDFQYVLIDTDVSANPTDGTGNFANMYGKTPEHQCPGCAYDEIAWFQDGLTVDVSPADDLGWTLGDTSPETVNGETDVTTSVSFDIGYNQTEGGGADFSYSNAVTRTLTDWQVTDNSSGIDSGWYYRSQYPYDSDAYWDCGSQQPIYADGCYLNAPNDLSLDTMQLHTQAVWSTPNVTTDWVTFDTTTQQHIVDLYCNEDVSFACQDNSYKGTALAIASSFQVNMAAVVPIPISSVTFDNNAPTAGQQVTGTVMLDSPAQVDTTIVLQSNSVNATLLPNVTVSQGQTSATFQIDTNANGLASGNSTVATIDAFYAQDVQAQLTITAP